MPSVPHTTDFFTALVLRPRAINGGAGQRTVTPEVTLDEKINQLFTSLRGPLYRYLVEAFGHPAEAEEIAQEAFLRLYRVLQRGEEVAHERAWLFRVAHNLALDQLKSLKFAQVLEPEAWERLAEARGDGRMNPEQHTLERERLARVRAALTSLSPQERQCLHLRAEGFRYREIGEILGISQWTVVEFLRRGIRKLMRETA
jgi:RNA polymerase sigma-70 factor, ECF subfamily